MSSENWHGHIKWLLERRGTSLSQIARDLSVSPSTVTRVSKGLVRSRRIEEAIAAAATFTPAQLWPAHYPDAAGGER
jgi:lambda repressor-like predicted transcriptional regulator